MELLENREDNSPFLGFAQKRKSNGLTTSEEFVIMSTINCHNRPSLSKMDRPAPAETNKRKKKQMIGPASRMKMMKSKGRQSSSEEALGLDGSQMSLQMPPRSSERMPRDIIDDPEFCISSVQGEVDDNDINIENDVFDCSSYNLTDRITTPPSERVFAFTSRRVNPGQDSLLGQVGICNLGSDAISTNGFQKAVELTDLTTQFLDLTDKNSELDRKLSVLKRDYEEKLAEIQAEKRVHEIQIRNIVKLVHEWRDSNYSVVSQSAPDRNGTGTSLLEKGLQQPTRTRDSIEKGIIKKYLPEKRPEKRSKKNVTFERPETSCYSPEPMFGDTGDTIEFRGSVSLESIDAELVCLSDIYGPKKSKVCVSKTTQENPIKEALKTSRGACNGPEKFTKADVIKNMSPVVMLNDIYANKREVSKKRVSIGNIKCGAYVVIKLSSKKKFEHYCAVVRSKSERGECFVQYMERKKDNEFIFPEKEIVYKIEEGDIVKVLKEPAVNVKGSRVYYTFSESLVDIEALK